MTKAKMAALEKSIAKGLSKELATLHKKYGFASLAEFVKALQAVGGFGPAQEGRRGRPAKATDKVKRRKRAVITDETRASVKKLVEAGKTGSQIAKVAGDLAAERAEHQEGARAGEGAGLGAAQSCQDRPAPALWQGPLALGPPRNVDPLHTGQHKRAAASRQRAVDLAP